MDTKHLRNELPFQLGLFFELSADLLCIAGFDGYWKKVNPAVCKLLGYAEEELYQRPIGDFIHPEDREITQRHRAALQTAKPLFNFENRYITRSGEVVWLSWTSQPSADRQLIFAVAKDVTYKKQLEEERNLLMTQMLQANHDLKQLHFTISHNLRAPVNNLQGIIELLQYETLPADAQALVTVLATAGANLKKTLDGYLDELTDQDQHQREFEQIPVLQTLQEVLQTVQELIRKSKATFDIQIPADVEMYGRKAYLHSIFLNLITNAIKYARPEVLPVITIQTKWLGTRLELRIADNGQGIDLQATQGKLFGLQQQFHQHSDSKGIGLFLVYHHVQRMQGSIRVESALNSGTAFVLDFPVQAH